MTPHIEVESQRMSLTEEQIKAIEPIEQYFLGHAKDDAALELIRK